jgi:uncharacterized protein
MSLRNVQSSINVPTKEIQAFCDRWHIVEFSLFGSVLLDDFNDASDIDVLVDFDPNFERGLSETIQMRDELQDIFGRKVDFIVKDALKRSANWLRRQNIFESAQIIYVA